MPAPAIPQNVVVQQANGQVLITWNLVAGATSYSIFRSTDNITFTQVGSVGVNKFLDTTVLVGSQYWYYLQAVNLSGSSGNSVTVSTIPTLSGDMSLGELRYRSQQRADRVNSDFVTLEEWNSYINQSYFELYDLLITTYENWFSKTYVFQTNGTDDRYSLPSDFYKLDGVDLGLDAQSNAWVTLKKFNFIGRNRYVFPQLTTTYLGVFNLRYRLMGDKLMFIPTPSTAQYVRVWYVPKMVELLQDTDIAVGVSGWTEYIIVDAAIKAMQKEESDVTVLMAQKMALIKRIEETAINRDEGQPDTIGDVRSWSERWGTYGPPNGDGGYGGW